MLLYNNVAGLRLFQGADGMAVANWHHDSHPRDLMGNIPDAPAKSSNFKFAKGPEIT
jgi:hypothetical protein